MDLMAEEIIEIADDSSEDYIKLGDDGDGPSIKFDSEHVNRARLRVDTRKWIMARLSPKKYGDKLQQEITGPGGVQPVLNILVSPIAPKALPESEE